MAFDLSGCRQNGGLSWFAALLKGNGVKLAVTILTPQLTTPVSITVAFCFSWVTLVRGTA